MGITSAQKAPFRSISEHFQGSGLGRQQELIWSPPGSSFWLPNWSSFFAVESELIFKVARTRVSRLEHDCVLSSANLVAAMLAVTISLSFALFPLSHPPRTACCLIVHAAQHRPCSLVPRFSSARFTNFIELPLHPS